MHYDQSNSPFEEYNALLILKTIKKYSHSDKVILQDVRDYINPHEEIIQNLLTNDNLPDSTNQLHRPSKKNSTFSSDLSIQNSFIKLGTKFM